MIRAIHGGEMARLLIQRTPPQLRSMGVAASCCRGVLLEKGFSEEGGLSRNTEPTPQDISQKVSCNWVFLKSLPEN